MIESISITNYRSFSKLTVPNVARVNLIVGTNNSGKTSLLEAMYLLTSEDPVASLISILKERGEIGSRFTDLRNDRLYSQNGYQISHIFNGRNFKKSKPIIIEGSAKKNSRLLIHMVPYQNRREDDISQLDLFDDEDSNIQRRYAVTFERNLKSEDPPKDSIIVTEDGMVTRSFVRRSPVSASNARLVTTNQLGYDELASLWDGITLTPKEDKVVEALQILEPRVERISFTSRQTSNSGILLKLKGEDEPVPLGSMGDGMRRILAIAASLVSVDQGTLLVDEIDTGLYYNVQTDMWRLVLETAERQKAQVFATTHSWDCVKAFQQALAQVGHLSSGVLIRLDPTEKGIEAVTYSSKELDIAIAQGIEVR